MNTEVQDSSETRKIVTVTVPATEVASFETSILEAFQKQAKVPGFRPGKAPPSMIRKRYAKEVRQELRQKVLSEAHKEGVENADFEVYTVVDFEESAIDPGQDATLTFTVDVVPGFTVPDYASISVDPPSSEVSESEIDDTINRILSQRAEFTPVDRAAQKGDYVRCSYEGWVGDAKIEDLAPDAKLYGTQKVTWEEAGSEDAPGVRAVVDGLVGMSAGDEKEVSQTFGNDFEVAALAGKTATYTIKVEEVREKTLPELSDELLQSLGAESEADLRQKVREQLEQRRQQEREQQERQQITEKLLEAIDFPIPESGIESETETILRDYMQQQMQQGASQEALEEHKEQLYESAAKAARNRVKSRLILTRIAEREELGVENEDLSRAVMQEAYQNGRKPDDLVKELRKDEARLNRMRRDIILGKTMDLLVRKARGEEAPAASEAES